MLYRNETTLRSRLGFTLIELMMTISLIIILVSVLTLALNSARTSAMAADTTSRLTSLKMATVRFRDDIGYLPAVLDMNRDLSTFPEFPPDTAGSPQSEYRYTNQAWYSITSPAEFLLGYGNRNEDGFGRVPSSLQSDSDFTEMPRFGIRHPSLDGVWRATDIFAVTGLGLMSDRQPSNRGKLYGPYLESENEQMFGRIVPDTNGNPIVDPVTRNVKVFYPGDPALEQFTIEEQQAFPMVIVIRGVVPFDITERYTQVQQIQMRLNQEYPEYSLKVQSTTGRCSVIFLFFDRSISTLTMS